MLRDKEQRKELAPAVLATGQLARMLSQLIDALQLQERPRENLRAPILLGPVLDDLVAEFGDPARRKGITLRVTTARGTALSQPVLLTSILRNLVRNAIDYTPRGGRVFVASRRCGPELRMRCAIPAPAFAPARWRQSSTRFSARTKVGRTVWV
jgi:signal transduction histidine kinase